MISPAPRFVSLEPMNETGSRIGERPVKLCLAVAETESPVPYTRTDDVGSFAVFAWNYSDIAKLESHWGPRDLPKRRHAQASRFAI